jgi:spore germination protein GerM
MKISRRTWWIAGGAAVVVGLAALFVSVRLLREPQPLRYRIDLSERGTALQTVTVYYLDPDSLALAPREREVLAGSDRQALAQELVAFLSEPGEGTRPALPTGVELLHFFEDGNGEAVLDFDQTIQDVSAESIQGERLRLSALTRTLAENLSGVERIRLLVHGQPLLRWGEHLRPGPVLEVSAW